MPLHVGDNPRFDSIFRNRAGIVMSAEPKGPSELGNIPQRGRRRGGVDGAEHERKGTRLEIESAAITDEAVRGIIDECIVPTLVERFIENLVRQTDEQSQKA
jgi:hypothetical protein